MGIKKIGGGGKKTTKIIIITISTIASIAVVAALLGFWYYSSFGRRKQERDREIGQEIPLRNNLARSLSMQLMDNSMHARDDDDSKGVELIDQTIVDISPISEALRLIHIVLLCVQEDPNE
ncbi:hypothetical protein CFP56_027248 [Quercus suber]|uniref:Uncharacterized protein n=1 Tax=Quercus suber TaxID=58331 RepID=A0AAW0JX26_QUESU